MRASSRHFAPSERSSGALGEPRGELLGQLQFTRTAARLGLSADEVRVVVEEWVMRRPLKHLRRLVPSGLTTLLDGLAARQVRLGALSDYPAVSKLRAMALSTQFSFALTTADPSINAFKPHPKGFWRACDMWGVTPQEVLYVGDRADTDATGAAAAGMQSFLLARRPGPGPGHPASGSLADLRRVLAV